MPTETRPRRGPYGKTRGRVETLGRVAYELVVEAGHRSLTMAEVARRAALTEAQVLHLFPSRDHLLVAALEHADARLRPEPGSPGLAEVPDPEATLAAAIRAQHSDPHVVRLFASMCAEGLDPGHPAHAWLVERTRRTVASYAQILRELQATGWAHPDVDPQRFGRQLVALWDGAQAHWLLDPSTDLGAEVAAGLRVLARADHSGGPGL
ncbi:TetR/AcrR family transcriptional regulator [Cellulomonas sp. GbtcB1]|jgi:AcrR family transcriptional regulator|uniref:TetR/AcrR family transcriptional regulator n=1 Tax=Cellulomonas sp. GbtcB1 TaxID=2824746 RepID=UPI001C308962|nr:TetR/AcrR family transcriptional regulator [Cellulomonas sp. GbtcB1]